jgi:hypothetical protein
MNSHPPFGDEKSWNLVNRKLTKAPPKKGKTKEQNARTHIPRRRQMNHPNGLTTSGTSSSQTPFNSIARSISNKERGDYLWLRKMASKYSRKFSGCLYMVRKQISVWVLVP